MQRELASSAPIAALETPLGVRGTVTSAFYVVSPGEIIFSVDTGNQLGMPAPTSCTPCGSCR